MNIALQHDGRTVSLSSTERQSASDTRFEPTPEQKLAQSLDYIAQLETEIRVLRLALARSARLIAQRDVLLRNALAREQELRADLISRL